MFNFFGSEDSDDSDSGSGPPSTPKQQQQPSTQHTKKNDNDDKKKNTNDNNSEKSVFTLDDLYDVVERKSARNKQLSFTSDVLDVLMRVMYLIIPTLAAWWFILYISHVISLGINLKAEDPIADYDVPRTLETLAARGGETNEIKTLQNVKAQIELKDTDSIRQPHQILYGVNGTGKTTLAMHFAGSMKGLYYKELGTNFMSGSFGKALASQTSIGATTVDRLVGFFANAKKLAKKYKKNVIALIDEMEVVMPPRSSHDASQNGQLGAFGMTTDSATTTLMNELTDLNDYNNSKERKDSGAGYVIFFGTTNYPCTIDVSVTERATAQYVGTPNRTTLRAYFDHAKGRNVGFENTLITNISLTDFFIQHLKFDEKWVRQGLVDFLARRMVSWRFIESFAALMKPLKGKSPEVLEKALFDAISARPGTDKITPSLEQVFKTKEGSCLKAKSIMQQANYNRGDRDDENTDERTMTRLKILYHTKWLADYLQNSHIPVNTQHPVTDFLERELLPEDVKKAESCKLYISILKKAEEDGSVRYDDLVRLVVNYQLQLRAKTTPWIEGELKKSSFADFKEAFDRKAAELRSCVWEHNEDMFKFLDIVKIPPPPTPPTSSEKRAAEEKAEDDRRLADRLQQLQQQQQTTRPFKREVQINPMSQQMVPGTDEVYYKMNSG